MSRQIVFLTLSGVGNSTAKKALVATGQYRNGVTCTTRPPRTNETDGVDYDFISPAAFMAAMDSGEMAEHASYRGTGTTYGILQRRIDEARNSTLPTLWVLNLTGLAWMQEAFPGEVQSVFLCADRETCRGRLTNRGDSLEDITKRQAGYMADFIEGTLNADHNVDTTNLTPEQVSARVLNLIGV